jgi:hypothetical protein
MGIHNEIEGLKDLMKDRKYVIGANKKGVPVAKSAETTNAYKRLEEGINMLYYGEMKNKGKNFNITSDKYYNVFEKDGIKNMPESITKQYEIKDGKLYDLSGNLIPDDTYILNDDELYELNNGTKIYISKEGYIVDEEGNLLSGGEKVLKKEGLKVNTTKAIDSFKSYFSVTSLGFNIFSGINNTIMGNLTNYLESAGGRWYNKKDWGRSVRQFGGHLGELIKDEMSRTKKSPLSLFIDKYDLKQKFIEFGSPLEEKSKLGNVFNGSALYFAMSYPEFEIQTTLILSNMNSHRIIDGKILSYLEWLDKVKKTDSKENKKLFEKHTSVYEYQIQKKEVKEFDSSGQEVETLKKGVEEKEFQKFSKRIKAISQDLHGNYSRMDRSVIMKYALGRLFMSFRQWMKPGWNRRFAKTTFDGKPVFDERLGAETGGYYTVAFEFMKNLWQEGNFFLGALQILTTKRVNGNKAWDKLPAWKKKAIGKATSELRAMIALWVLIGLVDAINDGDDDDWTTWWLNMGEYQIRRAFTETAAFTPTPFILGEGLKLVKSPMPAVSVLQDVLSVGYFTGKLPYDVTIGEGIETYESGVYAGQSKLYKNSKDLLPVISQLERLINEEQVLGNIKR